MGIWTVRHFMDKQEPTPLLLNFQGVTEMEEIEFVQMTYQELVPVTSKVGDLEFLFSVPATISGKMDMTQLSYELKQDSVLVFTLPDVTVAEVVIDLDAITDEYSRDNGEDLFLSGGGKVYDKVYVQIMDAIFSVKQGVLSNAIKDGILNQTDMEARSYLLRMANSMGYQAQFVRSRESQKEWEKDLEKRMGGKLWKDVKHVVQKAHKAIPEVKKGLLKKDSETAKQSDQ